MNDNNTQTPDLQRNRIKPPARGARLYTRDEFTALTRDAMYKALLYVSPTLAKGKSRARKEELIELYSTAASTDSIPVVKISKSGAERVEPSDEPQRGIPWMGDVNDSAAIAACAKKPTEAAQTVTTEDNSDLREVQEEASAHVHGPNCDHGPQRVNPEMPVMEMKDGAVFEVPPDPEDLLFVFKDTPRELTEKDKTLLRSVQKNFEIFQKNPAHNAAKRQIQTDTYALKILGIIVNPRIAETLKAGRNYVRDARRKMRAGVDISETVRTAQDEVKAREAQDSV